MTLYLDYSIAPYIEKASFLQTVCFSWQCDFMCSLLASRFSSYISIPSTSLSSSSRQTSHCKQQSMELTLTGASLNSDGNSNSNRPAAGSAPLLAAQPQPQSQQHSQHSSSVSSHSHDHSHSHSHGHGEKCSHDHGNPSSNPRPPNFQSVESIPVDKLLSNPAVLFSAIITSVKGGGFDTFKYLVDVVLKEEAAQEAPLKWGVDVGVGVGVGGGAGTGTCSSALGKRANDGHTIAHWTAKRSDDLRFIEYLTDKVKHVDIHVPSDDTVGMSPIHWAATEGSIPIVNFILKHLDNTSTCSKVKSSSASPSQSPPSLSLSLDRVNNNNHGHPNHNTHMHINARDKSGCTPLLIASQYGHADLAAFLIKRGADPNAVDDSHDTALHWAAYKGAVPVCGLLLHLNGVKDHLDMIDVFGQSPLHLASLRGNVDVVMYILEQAEAYEDAKKKNDGDDGNGDNVTATTTTTATIASSSFPAKLLNMGDKDGKIPLDLAIKKNKTNVELVLKQYMDKYCTTNRSLVQKVISVVKPFFSCKSWLSWLGLVSENGRPPKFIFWFVAVNMAIAFLYELVVYVPLSGSGNANGSGSESGNSRLAMEDYMKLHVATIMSFIASWITFILVHRTDPGFLGKQHFASSSNAQTCMEARIPCFDENKRIKREMHTLTNDLRNLYEETLESFASESGSSDAAVDNTKLPLCHSCHIARPHRSKHCRVLNRCVLLFDHHCPFVGTTIGLYNYKYFYAFVWSFTICEMLFGVTGVLYLRRAPEGTGYEVGKILIGLYFAVYMIMTLGLSVYHTQLVRKNLTTNEHANLSRYKYLKDDNGAYHNPFHRGCLGNFMSRCRPGKDAYMLVHAKSDVGSVGVRVGGSGSIGIGIAGGMTSNINSSSSSHGMDVEMMNVSDKKNDDDEEKLRLVQNVV